MRRSLLATGALAAVLVAASGCDPLGAASGGPVGSAPAGAASAPAGAASGGVAPSAAPSASADDVAAFCALAKRQGVQHLDVFDGQSTTPAEARQWLANLDAMAAAAPEEIHDDYARYDDFEHRLADAGGNATGDLADEAGGEDLRDAINRIAAFLDQNCGIHT